MRFAPAERDIAALVNDVAISRTDYRHALDLLSAARRGALTAAERRQVLDRLVEEELLFQRAEQIDLPRQHGNLRVSIVQAMVSFILDDVAAQPPSDEQLEAFYNEHKAWFTPKERFRVARIYLRVGETKRAEALARALRQGASFAALANKGDEVVVDVPDMLLPREKLFEYLGEELTKRVSAMKSGEISGPIITRLGIHFLLLRARQNPRPPRFADIKPQVARHYARRRDERALKEYLTRLRRESDIRTFP